MSESFKLHRLQQIDSQLDHAHARLRVIEATLNDNASIIETQLRFEAARNVQDAANKAVRKAEENVRANKLKLEQTESALYGGKVRNPKELQDLQNESEALKRFRTILDDRLLDAMIALEEADVLLANTTAALEETKAQITQQNSSLLKEQTNLTSEVNRLDSERYAASRSISPGELGMYEQLRIIRRGVAVTTVADNTCAACGSTLSSAQLHAARSPNQLTRCESCGRILYGG